MGCASDDELNVSIVPEEQPDEQAAETGQVDPIPPSRPSSSSAAPLGQPIPLLLPLLSLSLPLLEWTSWQRHKGWQRFHL